MSSGSSGLRLRSHLAAVWMSGFSPYCAPYSSRIRPSASAALTSVDGVEEKVYECLPPLDESVLKNKVEGQFNTNNARSMWQGINNITGFKGNKPATVNIAASLPDELNTFYARFEADNTAHTESAW